MKAWSRIVYKTGSFNTQTHRTAFQLIWSLDGKHVQTFALNHSASNYFCALQYKPDTVYLGFISPEPKKKKGEIYKIAAWIGTSRAEAVVPSQGITGPLLPLQNTDLVFS